MADRADVFHCRVQQRGEAEAEPEFFEARFHDRHVGFDVHTEFAEHIGRTAFAGHFAIAVLGDRHSRRCRDDRGRRADIEQLRTDARAGAAGINDAVREVRMGRMWRRMAVVRRRLRQPSPLFRASREEQGDFPFGPRAAHDAVDGRGGLCERQVVAAG